ncbi:glycoside hydrolase family 3 N-terminal domain-containing protein [uncultured Lactobacillus sp.]|uniref:glycoside hydrolase family 3 N-terminal domain-containing protein n=1 Tax=uncultured Lactobacillus sp. TaxID=153152 RepID=UPI00261A13D0|nr:glycoside hydrolase family 3 N-terminal domain-containing protein [uncultured Lactobacillus sp.]
MNRINKTIFTVISGLSVAVGCLLSSQNQTQAADQGVTEQQINQYIDNASLEQKVGQMYVSRTPQTPGQAEQDVAKYNLGGLIVYDADLKGLTQDQFKQKMQRYQNSAQTPLLVGVDQEGGLVSRLTHSGLVAQNGDQFAFPRKQYEDAEKAKPGSGMEVVLKYARENATLLRQLGINWNYAPDADYSNTTGGFIYDRTFGGGSYQATADYIKQVVPAWQHDNLIASTLKHFPGYGDAADTHTGFATRHDSLADIEKNDMLPFIAGMQAGADSVMVTHVIYDKIDPIYPASLSAKMNRLIRDYCHYNGLIVTDALEMGAITDFAKQHGNLPVDVLAVMAGNDMIMTSDYATGIGEIVQAVKEGKIKENQINASVKRILDLKNKLGLLTPESLNPNKHAKPDEDTDPDHHEKPTTPTGSKKITLNAVNYNSDNTIAYISGKVADAAAEGSMVMSVVNVKSNKVIATAVVGGKGEFTINVPVEDKKQELKIVSDDSDYAAVVTSIKGKEPEIIVNPGQDANTIVETLPEVTGAEKTVNYVPGYGVNVWTINNGRVIFTHMHINDGTKVKVFDNKVINGVSYSRIQTANADLWIQTQYLNTKNNSEEIPCAGILKVVYKGQGKVKLTDSKGRYLGNEESTFVAKNSSYKIFGKKTINNKTYYRLGTQVQWIPENYTKLIK